MDKKKSLEIFFSRISRLVTYKFVQIKGQILIKGEIITKIE
jgi:hypothetical protein